MTLRESSRPRLHKSTVIKVFVPPKGGRRRGGLLKCRHRHVSSPRSVWSCVCAIAYIKRGSFVLMSGCIFLRFSKRRQKLIISLIQPQTTHTHRTVKHRPPALKSHSSHDRPLLQLLLLSLSLLLKSPFVQQRVHQCSSNKALSVFVCLPSPPERSSSAFSRFFPSSSKETHHTRGFHISVYTLSKEREESVVVWCLRAGLGALVEGEIFPFFPSPVQGFHHSSRLV